MKNNNQRSTFSEKILVFLLYVLGILLILIGLPFFPVGGFIFVGLGVLCFFYPKIKKRKEKSPIINNPPAPPIVSPTKTPQVTKIVQENTIKPKTYKVTGTNHYIDNILSLAVENIDYDLTKKELIDEGRENERIYQYEFYPRNIELVPEPDNPYDPNAVKVIVDDILVGYIKAGSCSHILKVLKEDKIVKIDCEIGGGNYKYLGYDEDEESYYLDKDKTPYFVHLSIIEK